MYCVYMHYYMCMHVCIHVCKDGWINNYTYMCVFIFRWNNLNTFFLQNRYLRPVIVYTGREENERKT